MNMNILNGEFHRANGIKFTTTLQSIIISYPYIISLLQEN